MNDTAGQYWWQESGAFHLSNGKIRPESRSEWAFDQDLKNELISAWAYELVRRLFKVEKSLSPAIVDSLKALPPFPDLERCKRHYLIKAFGQLLIRPVVVKKRLKGYSEPIPPFCFDLLASDTVLVQDFLDWIKYQREKEAGRPATEQGQLPPHDPDRIANWQMVPMLDHKKGQGFALTKAQKKLRSDGKKLALEFLPQVLKALEMADAANRTKNRNWVLDILPPPGLIPTKVKLVEKIEFLKAQISGAPPALDKPAT